MRHEDAGIALNSGDLVRSCPRSHGPRGNAAFDAPRRPGTSPRRSEEDAERPGRHSHGDRGNERGLPPRNVQNRELHPEGADRPTRISVDRCVGHGLDVQGVRLPRVSPCFREGRSSLVLCTGAASRRPSVRHLMRHNEGCFRPAIPRGTTVSGRRAWINPADRGSGDPRPSGSEGRAGEPSMSQVSW